MSYRNDVQDVANLAIDGTVGDEEVDRTVASFAAMHGVEADTFAADVEERLTEMRAQRDEERSHLEG